MPAAFAAAVTGLLTERARREALGSNARKFIEAHHSWTASTSLLDDVLDIVGRQVVAVHAAGPRAGS